MCPLRLLLLLISAYNAPPAPAGLHLHLDSLAIHHQPLLAEGPSFKGNVLVDPTAKIADGCLIGPDVSIGAGCVIEDGVRLSNCVIMRGVHVKKHSKVRLPVGLVQGRGRGGGSRLERTAACEWLSIGCRSIVVVLQLKQSFVLATLRCWSSD